MLGVRQFRYSRDNLAYVIHNRDAALVIDGGAVESIADYLSHHGQKPVGITNTHNHGDHTSGNRELSRRTGAPFIDHRQAAQDGGIEVGGERVFVYATPGHTLDSVCFAAADFLVTGDTLFNGTVGNCFSGEVEAFFESICRLMALPAQTRIYAGHDYLADSLRFARRLEPGNADIDRVLSRYRPEHVVSTLADELVVNPFLRFDAEPILRLLASRNLPRATSLERWQSLLGIE